RYMGSAASVFLPPSDPPARRRTLTEVNTGDPRTRGDRAGLPRGRHPRLRRGGGPRLGAALPGLRPRAVVCRATGRPRACQELRPGLPGPGGVPGGRARRARAVGCLGWRDLRAGRGDSAQAAAGPPSQGGRSMSHLASPLPALGGPGNRTAGPQTEINSVTQTEINSMTEPSVRSSAMLLMYEELARARMSEL